MQSPILRLPKKIKCLLFFLLIKIDQDDTVSRYYWSHHKTIKKFSFLTGKSQKKSSLLNGRAIKREWGVKGRAIKETFFYHFFQRSKISTAIKLEGGGGLGLNGPAIKIIFFFFAASLRMDWIHLRVERKICIYMI